MVWCFIQAAAIAQQTLVLVCWLTERYLVEGGGWLDFDPFWPWNLWQFRSPLATDAKLLMRLAACLINFFTDFVSQHFACPNGQGFGLDLQPFDSISELLVIGLVMTCTASPTQKTTFKALETLKDWHQSHPKVKGFLTITLLTLYGDPLWSIWKSQVVEWAGPGT